MRCARRASQTFSALARRRTNCYFPSRTTCVALRLTSCGARIVRRDFGRWSRWRSREGSWFSEAKLLGEWASRRWRFWRMLTVRFSQNCSSRAAGQELRRRRAILSRHHHVAPPSTVQRYDSSDPHHLYLLSRTSRRLSLCLSHRQSYALFHPFDPAACFPDLVARASIPSFRGDQGNEIGRAHV